uniref:Defensin-like protein n=1 Tax=Cajanus cajan TaxID=3821 RepID=A0A151S2G5_CAJCA|nr:Defensin-like protein [Cajanus cajan]
MKLDVAVETAEGRNCLSKNHKFKGVCLSDTNCGRHICRTQGFSSGKCRGFCTKIC